MKKANEQIQKYTDSFVASVDELLKAKEIDILKV